MWRLKDAMPVVGKGSTAARAVENAANHLIERELN
jgi:hypothetical protein